MKKDDIRIGTKFGYWTVIEIPDATRHDYVRCRCICGKEKVIYVYNLLQGKSLSCGCKRKEGDSLVLKDGRKLTAKVHQEHVAIKYAGFGRKINVNNGTGVPGVSVFRNGRYRAYISIGKRQIHLGFFDKLDDAKAARKAAERRYFADRQEKADEIRKKLKKGSSK
ncbi:hypothetical protein WMO23_06775 [Megasphaera sp. CLA-AA-H81]|uniref:AP2/ERF domain-containing protein n=1 Tax=Megasphaera intestinihominis TaxID=3133159 RepID=A0ABV1CWC4_9FIRM